MPQCHFVPLCHSVLLLNNLFHFHHVTMSLLSHFQICIGDSLLNILTKKQQPIHILSNTHYCDNTGQDQHRE